MGKYTGSATALFPSHARLGSRSPAASPVSISSLAERGDPPVVSGTQCGWCGSQWRGE